MIEAKNLFAGYAEKEIIKDADIFLENGKFTAIIGKNGSGKSTLVKALSGIIRRKSGEILLDGKEIDLIKPKQRAQKLSYLPQMMKLQDVSVFRYVLYSRYPYTDWTKTYSDADIKKAEQAIKRFSIEDIADMPLTKISGGQAQKAALAFAYAQDAKNVLLDEPASFLDIAARFELMGLLKELAEEGKAVCAVLHDIEMALEFSDKVYVLEDGCVRFCGEPGEAVKSGVIESVFDIKVENIMGHFVCSPK